MNAKNTHPVYFKPLTSYISKFRHDIPLVESFVSQYLRYNNPADFKDTLLSLDFDSMSTKCFCMNK